MFRALLRNPSLLRLEVAFAAFNVAEWGVWLSLLVWAYGHGGATASAVMALIQLVPAALMAPYLGAFADRRRAGRVLLCGYLIMGLAMVVVAAAIATDSPPWFVFALAPVVNLGVTFPRPAESALLPGVVCLPVELTAARVVTGWLESGAVLVAPAISGVLLGVGGPALSIAVLATLALLAGWLVLPVPGPPPIATPGAMGRRSVSAEIADTIRTLSGEPSIRILVALIGSQYFLVGALDVLYPVLAIGVLGMDESGAGFLNACFGAGGVVGAAFAVLLVARRRLAPALAAGALGVALALGVLGLFPSRESAVALLALVGLGHMSLHVTGRILLERSTPAQVLARVFSLLESLMNVGLAFGCLVVPVFVSLSGPRAALVGTAIVLLVLLGATWSRLAAVDRAAHVPHVQIRLLQSVPIFAPLPGPGLEGLARALRSLAAKAGETVVREGEMGDAYYVVSDGEVAVTKAGREVTRLSRHEGFGEIALIEDLPRTATVTATVDCHLFSLEREPFILAVTGHAPVARQASDVVSRRLNELETF